MVDDLVTISNYSSSVEAHLARNRLLDEGVEAFVIDDVTTDIAGPYGNGIAKLQVPASHAELAQAILADVSHGSVDSDWVAASSELIDEELIDEASEPECSGRELNAERACRGAVFPHLLGLLPVQIYVFWLLMKVFNSKELLRPRYQIQAWLAAAINLPALLLFLVIEPFLFLVLVVAQASILLPMVLSLGMTYLRSRRIVRSIS